MPETERTIATDIPPTAAGNLFVDQDGTADQGDAASSAESGSMDDAVGPTSDGDTTETAEESTASGPSRVEVTFRHASGSARLLVPRDVALAELLPEFLEVAGVDERGDGWVLASGDGSELQHEGTLGEFGARHGALLVLKRRGVAPRAPVPASSRASRGSASRRAVPPRAKPARGQRPAKASGRALSERTARTLPRKLTAIERVCETLRELRGSEPSVAAAAAANIRTPGAFALPARAPVGVRLRDAWEHTDDRHRLEWMIVSPRLLRCVTIAVISPKGGVGKTTTAALLGSLLAFLRRDRVVAVDTNPDWGSLGRRLAPEHTGFIDDLLSGPLGKPHPSAIELDAQLGRGPDGLMLAPAPTDPERASRLDEDAYRTLFGRLACLVGMLILDCGTGLHSPAARAALACADQLVLVTDGEPDTASLAAEAAERRLASLAPSLVLVVNKLDRSSRVDVSALERRIDFADGLVLVPNHRQGADALHGSRFSWNHAPSSWQTAFRELAGLLAASWMRRELAR